MHDYAKDKIKEENIIQEKKAVNSVENAIFSKQLI